MGAVNPVRLNHAVLFVAAFFLVFWLRGRSQRRRHGD